MPALWHRYDNAEQRGDIAQASSDLTASGRANLMTDGGLISAAQLSTMTNRRAPDGVELPGPITDRQGWWGDMFWRQDFPALIDYEIGSLIWTLGRSKNRQHTLNLLKSYAIDSVQWMRVVGIIDRAEARSWRVNQDTAAYQLGLYRPQEEAPLWTPAWEVTIDGI